MATTKFGSFLVRYSITTRVTSSEFSTTTAWSFERWCRLSNCVAVALLAPFSKAYHVPVGSASLGIGSSRRWQRSMNWPCAAALSVRELPYHLEMNSCGVMRGNPIGMVKSRHQISVICRGNIKGVAGDHEPPPAYFARSLSRATPSWRGVTGLWIMPRLCSAASL
jgi:hypothetical protein